MNPSQPAAVVHVDLDGAKEIFKAHGWDYPYSDDPLFETGLENILSLLERNGICATLFVIASSVDDPRKLALLREAVRRGHGIGSHTITHPNLLRLSSAEKRQEICGSREKLEAALGTPVGGFRAPGYQYDRECAKLVAEAGYAYDSSIFPTAVFSQRFSCPAETLAVPHHPLEENSLWELPLPDHRPSPFPFSPSYSLLFGTRYFRWGLERFRRRGAPFVLLFHLTDAANPLPMERTKSLIAHIYTLSAFSRDNKISRCQKMLDLVKARYRLTTTQELLSTLGDGRV